MAEASRASGANVIAISGWALEKPRFFPGITAKRFAKAFIKDITVGIAGTGIKAGVLKEASDRAGVLPGERNCTAGHRQGAPGDRGPHHAAHRHGR